MTSLAVLSSERVVKVSVALSPLPREFTCATVPLSPVASSFFLLCRSLGSHRQAVIPDFPGLWHAYASNVIHSPWVSIAIAIQICRSLFRHSVVSRVFLLYSIRSNFGLGGLDWEPIFGGSQWPSQWGASTWCVNMGSLGRPAFPMGQLPWAGIPPFTACMGRYLTLWSPQRAPSLPDSCLPDPSSTAESAPSLHLHNSRSLFANSPPRKSSSTPVIRLFLTVFLCVWRDSRREKEKKPRYRSPYAKLANHHSSLITQQLIASLRSPSVMNS